MKSYEKYIAAHCLLSEERHVPSTFHIQQWVSPPKNGIKWDARKRGKFINVLRVNNCNPENRAVKPSGIVPINAI